MEEGGEESERRILLGKEEVRGREGEGKEDEGRVVNEFRGSR